jgi:outer membrane immunogenic protein
VWFGPAQAADLYGGPSIKDEPVYVSAPFSWTGFYVGGHAGVATGNTQDDPDLPFGPPNLFSTDFDMNGALYGAHVGYNIQKGNIVFGIEGTFDGSSIQGNTTCALILECERDVGGCDGCGTPRSPWIARWSTPWAAGAWADLNTEVSIAGIPVLSGSETHTGWVAGFGFAYAVSDRIIARIEYAHMDFGSETHDLKLKGGGPNIKSDVDADIDTIRLGVSLKFGGPL